MAKKKKKRNQMCWEMAPFKERPFSAVVSLFLAIGGSILCVSYIGNPAISAPLSLVFIWSLSPLFLTHTYSMSKEMVTITRLSLKAQKSLKDFKGVFTSDKSVLLTKLARQSFADKWQGLTLYVHDSDEAKKIAEFAGRYLNKVKNSESTTDKSEIAEDMSGEQN